MTMKNDTTSRSAIAWMLMAQIAALLPHMIHLDVWLVLLAIVCVYWRLMVHQGKWKLPTRAMRVFFVLTGGLAVLYQYSGRMSSEAGIALLILSFSLKLLELKSSRDAYLQIVLGYFVVATGFLFHRTIWIFFYSAFVIVLVTTALISLQYIGYHPKVRGHAFKMAALICCQAIPIMILLFVFFPRMVPLWALSMSSAKAPPSLNDSIVPGEITDLAGRRELAFRASFEGVPPPHQNLYWRALVYSHYDGERWSAWPENYERQLMSLPAPEINYVGRVKRYSIMMQPTFQKYLVSLDMPKRLIFTGQENPADKANRIQFSKDYRLMSPIPVKKTLSYQVESYLSYRAGEVLSEQVRSRSLQLPVEINPKTQDLAKQWFKEEEENPQRFITRVLEHFEKETFFYTLRPPIYRDDTIDQFMFEGRSGYCAHYAGAFVFMLRSVGIPARVVGGYMGGEPNWIGGYVSVYQYEAHAWAEAWLPGGGWTRFDPTGYVAPERILDSIQGLLDSQEAEQGMLGNFSVSSDFIRSFRQLSDYANYIWYRDVVGFNTQRQKDMLKKYFNGMPAHFLIIVIFTLTGLVGVGLLVLQRRSVAGLNTIDVLYQRFQRYLGQSGIQMILGETPVQYQQRAVAFFPEGGEHINNFTELYMEQQYLPPSTGSLASRVALRQMRKELRILRAKLILQKKNALMRSKRFSH